MTDDFIEQTILSPCDTEVRLEAWITDAKYLITPNYSGEWVFDFEPSTSNDLERIHEMGNRCVFDVEWKAGPLSNKEPYKQFERNNGFLYSNQLFPPKLNIKADEPLYWEGQQVSLCCHFRDLRNGAIVINTMFIDSYDDPIVVPVQENIELPPNYDANDDW